MTCKTIQFHINVDRENDVKSNIDNFYNNFDEVSLHLYKHKIGKFEYVKKYGTSALQHVLPQPISPQMKRTSRTQWEEIDTVADTLKKLSLMNSIHQTQLHGGRVNRI